MRVILDTNVWLDLFVFDDPRVRDLGALLAQGSYTATVSPPMLGELRAVLDYEHLRARCSDGDGLVERVRALCAPMDTPPDAQLPRCRDPHDQKFLDAAAASGAQLLVTKDRALLKLARRIRSFAILAPGRALDDWIATHRPS